MGFRINTNLQALQAYNQLQQTNASLAESRLRLATGLRINSAEDDSAGFSIATKLEARVRGQAQALRNIGDAKGMLTVAEGSLGSVMDILQTMKEKTVQANNDSLGTNERDAIQDQLEALTAEVGDILENTDFNGQALFTSVATQSTSFTFQVGADAGDEFTAEIAGIASTSLGNGGTSAGTALSEIDVTTNSTTREEAITSVSNAINAVSDQLASIGDDQKRLSFKGANLTTAKTNYEAARSRIIDADFAKEQVQIAKLQILQQTGIATLAQANAAPQSVLQLLR